MAPAALIAALLPEDVQVAATADDRAEAHLFPEERRLVADAVAARRAEFATARACAREALARLGVPATPIGGGPRGEPLWPAGVVGSITHCPGLRSCAVARAADVRALGIDAEPDRPLPRGVLATVARPTERARLAPGLDRVLFSAKESVYKAWFALTGEALTFGDAELEIREDVFTARLRDGACLDGRWARRDGLLATAVVVS